MMVSRISHLLGRVKRSDLVQNERNTSPDVVRGLVWAKITISAFWGRPEY